MNEHDEPEATEAEPFRVQPSLQFENEQLRQRLAQTHDALVQAQITVDFQNGLIEALRDAIAAGNHSHDEPEAVAD